MHFIFVMLYLGLICKLSSPLTEPERTIIEDHVDDDAPCTSSTEVCLTDTWQPIEPTTCYRPPTLNSPRQENLISTFNRTFFKEIRSRKVIKDHSYFRLSSSMSEEFFFNTATYMLENAGVSDDCLSDILARAVASIGTLSSDFYIQSAGNTVSKFLLSKGVLNKRNVVDLARTFVDLLEENAGPIGLRDPETFILNIGTSYVEFIDAMGLYFTRNYVPTYVLFMREYVPEETCACLFD